MPFEKFDPGPTRSEQPQLTVFEQLSGYLNAAADAEWFDDVDNVWLHADPDNMLLGIEPAGDDGRYSLSRDDGLGADVYIAAALRREFGINTGDPDGTQYIDLEWNDDHGFAVADLTEIVTDTEEKTNWPSDETNEQIEPSEPETTDEPDDLRTGPKYCGVCGKQYANRRGVKIHHGQQHDDGDADIRDTPPEDDEDTERVDPEADAAVPDPEDAPSTATVKDCAASVETFEELAELLDCGVGEARLLARDADVHDQLEDTQRRMGAPADA